MIQLGETIFKFLNDKAKLIEADTANNNSSDIIESLFGKYTARKSPNKLHGVTSSILFMPLYTELSKNAQNKFDFKAALEDTRIRQINVWKKENLTPNLMQLRINCLKKVA